jgi:oligopeptide/dipeptide ABC transporter ATP-binding protein
VSPPLLVVEDLCVARGALELVRGVDLEIARGECLALVGESGSGKSLTALALLGLLPAGLSARAARLELDGQELQALAPRARRRINGKVAALVLQDPLAALNPYLTLGEQLGEVLELHRLQRGSTRRSVRAEAARALGEVGIPEPERRLASFPHELSGGQRQRALIAIALAGGPKLLVADEPTSALDVTVQEQVLELLRARRERDGLALLFITHSLGVVAAIADRAAVMYAGRIVERAPAAALFESPQHPYTQGLLASAPSLERPLGASLAAIPGHPPRPEERPMGCAFAPRCALAGERCALEEPRLEERVLAAERTFAPLAERLRGCTRVPAPDPAPDPASHRPPAHASACHEAPQALEAWHAGRAARAAEVSA